MPASALALTLAAAFIHALWNLLLARERDPEAATAVALVAPVVVFAPLAAVLWDVDSRVWPFVAVTSLLQLLYFALLATAYRRADLSFVYPIARGLAPVLVLVVGAVAVSQGASAAQAVGVLVIAAGVLLVRGRRGHAELRDGALALGVAGCIAAYTLVDKHGIAYAAPIVYLELGMVPAALGYVAGFGALAGPERLRRQRLLVPALDGVLSFVAYVLVLAALERASAASVAAVRETSVVIATALAVPFLRERVGPWRLLGAVLVVGGIALLTL
jgi:drug/metabolite transporter (DMT)-like permease